MAIKKISANLLGNNAVTAASIAGGAISAADIANNSITAAKLSTSTFAIDSLTVNTSDLVVDTANNRVGIGTTSPTDKLHVGTSSGGTQLKIQSGLGVNNCLLHTNGTTDSWRTGMNLVLTNGSYEFYDDVNNIDRMVITSSGNVGIGTTDPQYKLSLNDASTSAYPLVLENGNIGTPGVHTGIRFGYSGNTYQKGAIIFEGQDASGRGKMYFAMEGTADNSNADETDAKLTIDYSGRVGIGTINPDVQLEIAGASGTSSVLKLSGRPDWTSGSGQYNVGNIYGENLGAGVNTTRIKFDGDDTDGSILFQTADTGTLRSVMYMGNNGTTEVPMIRANGWWNGALNTVGGGACEIGFDGTYAAVLGYDRNASQYKYLWLDGYNVTLASNGTQRAEVNGYGITPYQDSTYDLGAEANTAYWRRSYFKGVSSTGETAGQPDLSKTSRAAVHIDLGSGTSSGITFAAGGYTPAQTQAGIVCHANNSDGTHLGFFTTYTYSGGPYCHMKITNYGAIIGGVNVDLTSTSAPSNTTFYSTNGDITVQADNGNHYISDQLPGGYSRGQYGCMRADGSYMYFAVNGSYAAYMNSSGTLSSASDERLKENVTTLTDSLDKIKQLRGVNFTWKDENRGTENNIGFIAQEVESIYPELVGDGGLANTEDGEAPMKHVSYEKLVPALVEAIKELSDKNDALQARLDSAGL